MIAVTVGPNLKTVVIANPTYFDSHPILATPADLEAHTCVNYRLLGGGGLLAWEFEDPKGKEIRVRTSGQLIVNDEHLAGAAVRAGVGLGYMMEHDVAQEIAAGTLVQVLADGAPATPDASSTIRADRSRPPCALLSKRCVGRIVSATKAAVRGTSCWR